MLTLWRLKSLIWSGGATFEPLSWSRRLNIAIGAARGLAFLHSSEKQIIYRDFKASNILLDSVNTSLLCKTNARVNLFYLITTTKQFQDYTAKLSDFGLAKNGPAAGKSHVTTRIIGTYGYAAPEYVATGRHRSLVTTTSSSHTGASCL